MAVRRELSNMVREPVVLAIFLCSLRTNRVKVIVSTLISSTEVCDAMTAGSPTACSDLREFEGVKVQIRTTIAFNSSWT